MSDYRDIAERFARETANHVMEIKRDDGLYRHLRFKHPEHGSYWFDLITVPRALIFRGDGESFVFSRIDDMFEFFRSGLWSDGSIHINAHYWAEKLTSDRDSVMKYDQNLFEKVVKEHVADAIRDRTAPRGISRAIRELLENGDITWEGGARQELADFEYGETFKASCVCGASEEFPDAYDAALWKIRHPSADGAHNVRRTERVAGFTFEDTSEWQLKDYHWWFLWALHGIVWGIAQYDAAKSAAVQGGDR
ncbi:hypothetical protein ACLQ2R_17685 [Streptosporangium sp. DT93]|uniref:hypothetical protein n=1 Tax=Streptosporangium sp. DT93 TaxID=3393428 RepID=UPI003CEE1E1D